MLDGFSDKNVPIKFDDEQFKFLGVKWNQKTDCLGVFVDKAVQNLRDGKPSKRSLLSGVACVFDPTGIVSCITIQAKILLQRLWKDKIDWDVTLQNEHLKLYNEFTEQLSRAGRIMIKRTNSKINQVPSHTEIHVFSDASNVAYGAVVYAREFFKEGKPKVKFLMSKAKVTPIKGAWNIHRLELMAAIIAVRLVQTLKETLNNSFHSVSYWTDNSSVIGCVRLPSR